MFIGSNDFAEDDFDLGFEYKRRQLAKILAQKSYRTGEFILASGQKSDYYLDCRVTSLTCHGAKYIGYIFNAIINKFKFANDIRGVGGMTMGADPLVTATSMMSADSEDNSPDGWYRHEPLNALIVRKAAKDHGTTQWVEGIANFNPGDQIVMLEDVVTTGGSLLKACDRIEDAGLNVAACLSIIDRQQGGSEAITKRYPYVSIYTIDSFRKIISDL